MIEVCQDVFGAPSGNCFAACVASVLEIDDLSTIPSYFGPRWLSHGWQPWWGARGLVDWWVWPNDEHGKMIVDREVAMEPAVVGELVGGFFIGAGPGPRGCNHAVVFDERGRLAWDPQPVAHGAGILKLWDAVYFKPVTA